MEDLSMFQRPRTVALEDEKPGTYGTGLIPPTRPLDRVWLHGEQVPNQFFRRSHQLPVAITFDPELRLTHGLRLREALVILFAIIIQAKRGTFWSLVIDAHKLEYLRVIDVRVWRLKGVTKVKSNGKLVLGYSMTRRKFRVSIELGVQVQI
ncbi:hypothetical protein PIB30_086603 [Stylosanthes scabra]|uniref:Uncharacterized protein n=1 Tax=Stylosanthes scabra TaxID=79078 RepID=A0ABU6VRM1_9FABA|nr:hypothetical protein [Stylosanthes scabra]